MQTTAIRHLAAVFALIPIAAGVFFMLKSVEAEREARASLTWPSAPGEIVNRNLTGGKDGRKLHVDYTYTVDGKVYQGRRLAFAADKADYPEWAERFSPRTRVPVYYKPGQPATAVLVPGGESVAKAVFWAGLCFIAFGIYAIWHHFRGFSRI
jgi:hypothetical protein